ncbi:MAG TPA: GvpL/GvpF family gas vesicle protein [Vicinamibacteria bacterium]|nr:GvpL/GvpF family gas vesicle protein [Vicinamibacteria bacterium]
MTRVLYLYAVLARAPRGARVRGLAREPVRFVRSGRLVAAVGEMARAPRPQLANLRAHDRVVRRLTKLASASLPARFGSVAADPEALRESLRPRARRLLRALARVAGREQMTLRVAVRPSRSEPTDGPGTRHLRRLLARDPRGTAGVRELLDGLRPLVRAEEVDPAPDDRGAGRIHHLVDRGSAGRYRAQVRRSARDQPGLRVSCTGPWAPYSFAGGQA